MSQYLRTILSLLSMFLHITLSLGGTYNVMDFGAQAGGTIDSTKAFNDAWDAACASPEESKVYAPGEEFLLAKMITFSGQGCTDKNISVQIDGTLVAPSDYTALGSDNWIIFEDVHWVTVYGGTLDGKGNSVWECKASGNQCPNGATTLGFYSCNNVAINNIHLINSQSFHVIIDNCQNINIRGIHISNPGTSPNTDGVHVENSSDVTVFDADIGTGDDCISIGHGVENAWIEKVSCGPGHGISIGSLGRYWNEHGVQNVTVKNVTFYETENGVRIKTWSRKSNGYVKQVLFQNITMANVVNPIIIDQNYCPHDSSSCPHEGSGVKISDVTYQQIHGTSAGEVALALECSNTHPCGPIILNDVHLTYGHELAEAQCSYVSSKTSQGTVVPDCTFGVNRHPDLQLS